MKKIRFIVLYLVLAALFGGIIIRLFFLSRNSAVEETAVSHGSYSIKIATQRGTIYDRNMSKLVNEEEEYYAAVSPLRDAAQQLAALIPHVFSSTTVLSLMEQGKPFVTRVDTSAIHNEGISVVSVKKRYSGDALAPHVVGYIGNDGKGVSGIEKAFDSVLSNDTQTVTARFAVDAKRRTLQGVPCTIDRKGNSPEGGVVLTLNSDIQKIAQKAAVKYMKSGAVVVMDSQSGDILACVSVPTFSQDDVAASLQSDDSPMINRAFTAYDVGSIFKIVLAAEALETGISENFTYDCTGKINVSGKEFTCERKHGRQVMGEALANSCNTYFITLGQKLGGAKILQMARKLGFGKKLTLAPGLDSAAGVIPTEEELKIPAALANFSFGQGNLMATPVQIARMISAVANGGMLPVPRLVMSVVDENRKVTKEYPVSAQTRVFSEHTAGLLRQFLIETVEEGTGKSAKPAVGGAGGKTSTAQTGWVKNGKTINQAWFGGFYPAQNPRYTIVVIAENGVSGGSSAAPVFREIADGLAPYCGYTGTFSAD